MSTPRHRRLRLALSIAAASTCIGGTAGAYVFYKASESSDPLRWFRRSLEFRLGTSAPEEFPVESLQGLVQQAFDAWTDTPCAKVPEVTYMGTTTAEQATAPTTLRDAPDNVIVFIHSQSKWVSPPANGGLGNSPSWIAITKIAHNTKTGEIVDADMEINDGGFKFSTDDSPAPDEVDFLSMITHEAGHYFGMDHSLDATATMFASYSRNGDGATQARTLAQDDTDGICLLYTDVPESSYEGVVDDADSGNGCAGGDVSGLVGGLAGLGVMAGRRRRRG